MCLSGAAALVWVTELLCTAAGRLSDALRQPAASARTAVPAVVLIVFCAVSLSRIVATHRAYVVPTLPCVHTHMLVVVAMGFMQVTRFSSAYNNSTNSGHFSKLLRVTFFSHLVRATQPFAALRGA